MIVIIPTRRILMNYSLNEKNMGLGKVRSVIRETFEYGNMRAAIVGRENVYDFSLGNPSISAPASVDEAIKDIVSGNTVPVHGYTSAPGDNSLRQAIVDNINKRFNVRIGINNVYVTCGAAASLTVTLGALCNDGDNVIAFAPFFPEYRVFAEASGAQFRVVDADTDAFQINFDDLDKKLDCSTKALIINSPNNPSGAVLTKDTIVRLCDYLAKKEQQFGHSIYLIADEPYRELVYGDVEVPYVMNYYDDAIVCYSWSKSLSLPGERVGYIAINPKANGADDIFAAVCGSGRALGFVCAPSMMQKVIAKNIDAVANVDAYRKNRDLLYNALCCYGYECVKPDGAFYLFVKSPEEDAKAFCEKAKALDILLVPSDSFGVEGYVRISYCVSYDMIERSLPYFEKLMEMYK